MGGGSFRELHSTPDFVELQIQNKQTKNSKKVQLIGLPTPSVQYGLCTWPFLLYRHLWATLLFLWHILLFGGKYSWAWMAYGAD